MKDRHGMIHGRFQPFHNGHLEYLRKARGLCQVLLIGITNPDPSQIVQEAASAHRHLRESNPFTFFERMLMIKETLIEEGYDLATVHIIPFPVHHPDRWRFYIPKDTVHYLRVFSPWEQEKFDRMVQRGFTVRILDPGAPKGISGEEVRRRMMNGEDWEGLVPPAVARVIKAFQGTSPSTVQA